MNHQQKTKTLIDFLCSLDSAQDMKKVLKDILTDTELQRILERLELIEQLDKKIPQRDIKADMDISIALVTRGSHALKNNHGGFPLYLDFLRKNTQ